MGNLTAYMADLTVTQGAGAGEKLQILPWQARFIKGFERSEGDTALSVARGNGKTTLVAALAAACIDGPLAKPRGEVVVVASSFAQGRIAFEHALAFLREKGYDLENRKIWRLQDSQNAATVEHKATGARIRCIGSDPSRAHGLAPVLVLADEPAQWPSNMSDRMRQALLTSMGKIDGARMIALGTRPADPTHWFEQMLNGGCDYSQIHAARESDPPTHWRTVKKANPSLSIMPALEKRIRAELADAKRDPSLMAGFKALRLNLGIDDTMQATLLDARTWEKLEGEAEMSGRYSLGIDLGSSAAMSAVACYFPDTGFFDVLAAFPHVPPLSERGLRDGVGPLY